MSGRPVLRQQANLWPIAKPGRRRARTEKVFCVLIAPAMRRRKISGPQASRSERLTTFAKHTTGLGSEIRDQMYAPTPPQPSWPYMNCATCNMFQNAPRATRSSICSSDISTIRRPPEFERRRPPPRKAIVESHRLRYHTPWPQAIKLISRGHCIKNRFHGIAKVRLD